MKNVFIIIGLCFVAFVGACGIACLPAYIANAQKTALASDKTISQVKEIKVNLSTDTEQKTEYLTTFSVAVTMSESPSTGFCFNENVLFADNVVSVDIVEIPDYFPQNIQVLKSTSGERAYYYISSSTETWTEPSRVIYVKLKVISTGEIEFYEKNGYSPTILNLKSEIPSENKDAILDEIMNKVDGIISEQNNTGLDKLWEIVRPFVVYCLSALLSGAIVAGIISAAIKKKYDTKSIANEVLKNLTEKDISIDIAALTKREIAQIGAALKNGLQEGMIDITEIKKSVALLCSGLAKSKLLTQEERETLVAQAKTLDEEAQSETHEKVTVRLEKTDESTQETNDGGLFGYLEK